MEKRLLNHQADKIEMALAVPKAPVRVWAGELAPRTIQLTLRDLAFLDANRGQSDSLMRIQNHRVRIRQTQCESMAGRKIVSRC